MARTAPQVTNNVLIDRDGTAIAVGEPAWYAWLEQATNFAFIGGPGSFTARKERRARGGWYWKAYRTLQGESRRAYLGKSDALTLEWLNMVAEQLASRGAIGAAHVLQGERDRAPSLQPSTANPQPFSPNMAASGAGTLLRTKLYLPHPPPRMVSRPRLLAQLDTSLSCALTLILAPAGFGKTTLLAAWLSARTEDRGLRAESAPLSPRSSVLSTRIAWLSLDESENQLVTFLRYLIAALQTVMPAVGRSTLALLQAPQLAAPEDLLTTLINDLTEEHGSGQSQSTILVLDDYHVITDPAIHRALTFLLEHMPPTLHLIIASREEPALPLHRLRGRGKLNELRAAQLRCTIDEAATFLCDVMQLALAPTDIAVLEQRTEGWIAGLQFAALAMRSSADQRAFIADFAGSHSYVHEYLGAEVLDRLPGHVRTFLLRTSILSRMCGPLCDAVMLGGAGGASAPTHAVSLNSFSQVLLEYLERANLFVVPLDDEHCWYRYHQLFGEMLRHRLRSGASPREVAILHQRAAAWYEQEGLIVEAMQHAREGYDELRAAAASGPVQAIGNLAVSFNSITCLARLQSIQGRLRAATAAYARAGASVSDPAILQSLDASPSYYFGLGDIQREWNELDAAEHNLLQGLRIVAERRLADADVVWRGYLALARLKQARDDHVGVRAALDAFEALARERAFVAGLLAQAGAARVRLALAQGDLAAAVAWADSSDLQPDDAPAYPHEAVYLTWVRVRIAQERQTADHQRLASANQLLDRWLYHAEAGARLDSVIDILILQALVAQACDDSPAALAVLARALTLAAPEGYMRRFLDEGASMAELLARSVERGMQNDPLLPYIEQLLAAFPKQDKQTSREVDKQMLRESDSRSSWSPHLPLSLSLVEPLSPRELEVLRLLAAGRSNTAIANELVVAVSTVKSHINSIFGKLGVNSRLEAVLRAQEFQLL
jgi:ATP/maltotriose-dependent transcriptional regulator MalT